jgi:hypothetical protein
VGTGDGRLALMKNNDGRWQLAAPNPKNAHHNRSTYYISTYSYLILYVLLTFIKMAGRRIG